MCKQVLELLDLFSSHGHSGTTSQYAINIFEKLAKFKPLVPLRGEDWEWNFISDGVRYLTIKYLTLKGGHFK